MDVYESLRRMLDTHSAGCPPAPEIIEILKMLFTDDEARVALGLGFHPFTVDVIARRAGTDPEKTRNHLESMSEKGLVFSIPRKGEVRYGIVPTMPGLYEFPVMNAEPGPFLDRLASLWKDYMPKLSQCMGTPSMPISRVIPIEEEVAQEKGVLPYEKVYEMIDRARAVGIANCACRVYRRDCDAPLEACMVFDDICEYLTFRGIARAISKEEMKQLLKTFDEAGLVHQINNSQEKLDIICNCCPCCCALLRCLNTYENPHAVNASGFIPHIDLDACTGCGVCEKERCPMKGITIQDHVAALHAEACIGCGLCVTGCPEGAIKLLRKEEWRRPVTQSADIGMTILKERGKVKDILPYLDHDADPDS